MVTLDKHRIEKIIKQLRSVLHLMTDSSHDEFNKKVMRDAGCVNFNTHVAMLIYHLKKRIEEE